MALGTPEAIAIRKATSSPAKVAGAYSVMFGIADRKDTSKMP